MNIIKQWRIDRLLHKKAVIEARVAAENMIIRQSGILYPNVIARNAADLASVKFKLEKLGVK